MTEKLFITYSIGDLVEVENQSDGTWEGPFELVDKGWVNDALVNDRVDVVYLRRLGTDIKPPEFFEFYRKLRRPDLYKDAAEPRERHTLTAGIFYVPEFWIRPYRSWSEVFEGKTTEDFLEAAGTPFSCTREELQAEVRRVYTEELFPGHGVTRQTEELFERWSNDIIEEANRGWDPVDHAAQYVLRDCREAELFGFDPGHIWNEDGDLVGVSPWCYEVEGKYQAKFVFAVLNVDPLVLVDVTDLGWG